MDDDKLFADPLRHLDARFEPVDPIFDADEAEFPRFRRRRPRAAAAAILATLACSGAERPAVYAEDSILVQLQRNAAPPPSAVRADDGPPILALAPVATEDEAPLLRVPIDPGTDPASAADAVAGNPGVAFAEPVYLYRQDRVPNGGWRRSRRPPPGRARLETARW